MIKSLLVLSLFASGRLAVAEPITFHAPRIRRAARLLEHAARAAGLGLDSPLRRTLTGGAAGPAGRCKADSVTLFDAFAYGP